MTEDEHDESKESEGESVSEAELRERDAVGETCIKCGREVGLYDIVIIDESGPETTYRHYTCPVN